MDWHMYLILFIAVILFIGIVLFAQRKSKDPVSLWNRKNASIYFKESDFKDDWYKPHLPYDHNDTMLIRRTAICLEIFVHRPFLQRLKLLLESCV